MIGSTATPSMSSAFALSKLPDGLGRAIPAADDQLQAINALPATHRVLDGHLGNVKAGNRPLEASRCRSYQEIPGEPLAFHARGRALCADAHRAYSPGHPVTIPAAKIR